MYKWLHVCMVNAQMWGNMEEIPVGVADEDPTWNLVVRHYGDIALQSAISVAPGEIRSITDEVQVNVQWCPNRGLLFTFSFFASSVSLFSCVHLVKVDKRNVEIKEAFNTIINLSEEVGDFYKGLTLRGTWEDIEKRTSLSLQKGIVQDTCAICQQDLSQGQSLRRISACGHFFHPVCIEEWILDHKAECPICKHSIKNEETSLIGE